VTVRQESQSSLFACQNGFESSIFYFCQMSKIRNNQHFIELCDLCVNIEPRFQPVIEKFGYPPFWHREPDFATLILTILEQQVSLASAKSSFNKLVEKIKIVTPENLLKLTGEELRQCYFSRQKASYSRILANEIISGKLNLEKFNSRSAEEIRSTLIKIKGIGHWTIDMYLLMSLHFADIFPPGDLATIKAVYELELVTAAASKVEIVTFMKKFSPFQSVATYILWHSYIERRNLKLE
jgi:DNA-3-methyladenine glycosylase II